MALPDTSLTMALAAGGREHYGWGGDRHLLATLVDSIGVLLRATGNFKKPPKINPIARPGSGKKSKADKAAATVASLYQKMQRR